jgi:hypothetical protein
MKRSSKMKARILFLCVVLVLCLTGSAMAKEVVLPAGTLLTCMMDEPNFSSATASVGDPFLCHPRSIQMFGKSVFPRGAYLVGHLEADKEPGHFVGKGYLKLSFDRIGLADTDLPRRGGVDAASALAVESIDTPRTRPASGAEGRNLHHFAPDGRCRRAAGGTVFGALGGTWRSDDPGAVTVDAGCH